MIGHRNPRNEDFGKASARLDDLVNLIPARLTGPAIAAVSGRGQTLQAVWRDAGRHRSPNAAWPEAAMAGALDVRLSGPRVYGDQVADEPWLNEGARDPLVGDLARGLRLYVQAMILCGAALVGMALLS